MSLGFRFEQEARPSGLRPQILLWRSDLFAKKRGSMPGPARIIENVAGERYEIRISSADDCFRLFEAGDQADRNKRYACRGLDRPRERYLVTGAYPSGASPPLDT
jgi:hypothetical protein